MRLRFLGMASGLLLSAVAIRGQIPRDTSDSASVRAVPGTDSTVARATPADSAPIADSARPVVPVAAAADSQVPSVLADTVARIDSSKVVLKTDSAASSAAALDTVQTPTDTAWKDSAAMLRHMGVVVVHGQLRGKLKAQDERKQADNRKDVLSIEAIQEHPDPDVADALARAPGVTLQQDQGEGHYVQIRGSEPRLSTVTINGQKMTSSSGDTRAVDLDVIPVDQLSEIEVTKVLMPEMDGDAIGGTVNLVTPGALDTHMVLKALLAGGENDLSGRPLWQGSAALSRRFLKDGALGVYLGGSWFRNETRTDDLEMTWDTTQGNRGVIWNLEQREYHNEKERTGASGRLDWRTPGGSIAYLTGNWSQTDDSQLRDRFTITREGTTQIPPYIDSFDGDGVKYVREVRQQERVETVSQATLGGTTQAGPVLFDLSGTGSSSSLHQDPNFQVDFVQKSQMTSYIDPSNPDVPTFNAFKSTGAVDPRSNEATNYWIHGGGVQTLAKDGEEDDLHGRADARLSLGDDSSWEIRAGGKWGWNHKDQEVSGGSMANTSSKPPSLYLNQVLSSDSGVGFYDGHYTIGPLPDVNAVKAWIAANGYKLDTVASTSDHVQNDPLDYSVVERHWAGYAETKWHLGDFSAVGGLRLERYEVASTGNDVVSQLDESWSYTVPVTVDRTFDFLLPMVSARWSPIPELVGRASYTRSFSLPDAMDLLPTTQVDLLDLTEKVGNPDLKATLADAVELDLEWYRKPRGMASIGVFGKRLADYVFPVVWELWDDIRKAGFTYYSKANGDVAYLEGVELEAQQPFDFLPSFLSGLGVEGNYTWTHSSTTLPGRTGESTLPGQSEHSGNIGIRYDFHGFSAVVSANFQSPFLFQVTDATDNDTWVDWHKRLDVSVSQRLGHGLLVYAQAANLTNSPYRIYMGDTYHPTQIEYNGRTFEGGIRISL